MNSPNNNRATRAGAVVLQDLFPIPSNVKPFNTFSHLTLRPPTHDLMRCVGYGHQIGAVFSSYITLSQAIGKTGALQVIDLHLDNRKGAHRAMLIRDCRFPSISKSTSLNLSPAPYNSLRTGRCFLRWVHPLRFQPTLKLPWVAQTGLPSKTLRLSKYSADSVSNIESTGQQRASGVHTEMQTIDATPTASSVRLQFPLQASPLSS
ncbi:hypothetical protein FS837_010941 [Tulasnella sp. UAMH 9824]|nr:hypothetical protein FS837_010941 [Tulasnella sp. UAMH 9824]